MVPSWPSTPIVLFTAATVLLLSLPLALGCGGDGVPPSRPADAPGPSLTAREADCRAAFSPDEALLVEVAAAAERWGAATGCAVEASDAGVPVVLAASIERPDGSQAPGATSEARDLVEINVRSGRRQRAESVLHELGHALGGDHTLTDGVLSGDKGRRHVIDAAALETVCSRLPCPAFNPEEP